MEVIVLATDEQRAQLAESRSVTWVGDVQAFAGQSGADAFIDFTFEPTAERIAFLTALLPKLVIVNSVTNTLPVLHPDFIRFNGWATFFESPFWEAACIDEKRKEQADAVFALLGKTAAWLPDTPGFVTARVVSMIINEAYLALEEGVSTKEEINTAMKLGTAYPYGPFAWADRIGLQHITTLLQALSRQNARYTPAAGLVHENNKVI